MEHLTCYGVSKNLTMYLLKNFNSFDLDKKKKANNIFTCPQDKKLIFSILNDFENDGNKVKYLGNVVLQIIEYRSLDVNDIFNYVMNVLPSYEKFIR